MQCTENAAVNGLASQKNFPLKHSKRKQANPQKNNKNNKNKKLVTRKPNFKKTQYIKFHFLINIKQY